MGLFSRLTRRPVELDEDDFQEEVRAHLAIAAEERIADGADREEARYAALREFGNVARTTEDARRVWTPRWLEWLRDQLADVRYAVRTLARNPAFSLTVIAVLTLGIGVNATVFTMLKGTLLTPLAGVEGSANLVTLFPETSAGRQVRISYEDYRYFRDHAHSFSGLLGSVVTRANVGRGKGARQVWGELVTGNYFEVLGVRAHVGRTLLPSDDVAAGRHPVVVLGDAFWRREFNADSSIVGRTIEVNNHQLTVVGIADPAFRGGTTVVYDVALYVPVTMAPDLGFTFTSEQTTPAGVLSDPRAAIFYPQGYLREGATMADAAAEAGALWAERAKDRPITDPVARMRVVPFWQTPNGAPSYILPTLSVLIAMGLLVLLIACANLAGIVAVRGVSRRGEIALRLALGASRGRVVRLLVVENLVLAVPGALLGALLAGWAIPALVAVAEQMAAPDRVFFNVAVDYLVIGFAAATAAACTLVFGFVPAVRSSRVDLVSVINEDASPRGASRGRLRPVLVVTQVAVSLLLLVGAGLVTRSLDAARRAYPGFDANQVASVGLELRQNAYDEARGRVFYRKLLDEARRDPAVSSATLAMHIPLGMQDTRVYRAELDGYEAARGEDLAFMANVVGPGYFATLRIPLLAGRAFEDRDDETSQAVAVVNRTLAERFWGGAAKALGRRVRLAGGGWRTVIGVVADVKYARINEPARPYVYLPLLQSYRPATVLHVRGEVPVDVLVQRARAHVEALDGDLPVVFAKPMLDQLRGSLIFYNLTAMMLFIFGTAGMALAALGTYGLVSYTVKQSTHEIGIRMALGASGCSVIGRFLGRGLTLGAAGVGLGVVAALGLAQLLGSVLYGVSAFDAISFARALAIVLGGVLVASFVPAWRAARINPLRALRHQ